MKSIRSKFNSMRDDIQMSFAASGETLSSWELWRYTLRQLWREWVCSRLGHKGESHADSENGRESFSCDRCGYSHDVRW